MTLVRPFGCGAETVGMSLVREDVGVASYFNRASPDPKGQINQETRKSAEFIAMFQLAIHFIQRVRQPKFSRLTPVK